MNLYISRTYRDRRSAGNKAKTDMELLMERRGFRNIGLRQRISASKCAAFFRNLTGVVKAICTMRRGDTLVLQYPMKKYFSLVCRTAHRRGVRVVALIHDLGSFRRKALTPAKEIRRLAHADFIIAANDRMARWLADHGLHRPMTTQRVWDYLSESQPVTPTYSPHPVICYAGSLSHRKNEFLYRWGPIIDGYSVNLYGNGFDAALAADSARLNPCGYVPSDQLISSMSGNYGLIWDGDSTDTCSGNFGEYLRYNNPHKTALYLRAGLPLIAWSQSAVAQFIREEQLGIVVDSLALLPDRLREVSPTDYQNFTTNVRRVADRISQGLYFYEALDRAGVK